MLLNFKKEHIHTKKRKIISHAIKCGKFYLWTSDFPSFLGAWTHIPISCYLPLYNTQQEQRDLDDEVAPNNQLPSALAVIISRTYAKKK